MNMKKTTFTLFIIAILATLVLPIASAAVGIEYVEVNGDEINENSNERLELTEELDIKVRLNTSTDVENIKISAEITGYEYADKNRYNIYDVVVIDNLDANDKTSERLTIQVPKDIDQDTNKLIVRISDNTGTLAEYKASLNIQGADNFIDILRVSFDPAEVVAGRALRSRVRLENLGEENEDDVYVTMSIPALGPNMVVSADVDGLDEEDLTTTEDLLLRIPSCVEPGVYDVVTTVYYDNGYESNSATDSIRIIAGECGAVEEESTDRTVITPPSSQEIVAGAAGTSFPVIIENDGTEDKTYLVSVTGVNGWGAAEVSNPATFVRAGNTEVVYVYVSANPDAVGQKSFVMTVSDGQNSRDIAVQTRILPGAETSDSSMDWKQWVYTGIILLLVIIVILGLAIGFRKASKDEEEEYY